MLNLQRCLDSFCGYTHLEVHCVLLLLIYSPLFWSGLFARRTGGDLTPLALKFVMNLVCRLVPAWRLHRRKILFMKRRPTHTHTLKCQRCNELLIREYARRGNLLLINSWPAGDKDKEREHGGWLYPEFTSS